MIILSSLALADLCVHEHELSVLRSSGQAGSMEGGLGGPPGPHISWALLQC